MPSETLSPTVMLGQQRGCGAVGQPALQCAQVLTVCVANNAGARPIVGTLAAQEALLDAADFGAGEALRALPGADADRTSVTVRSAACRTVGLFLRSAECCRAFLGSRRLLWERWANMFCMTPLASLGSREGVEVRARAALPSKASSSTPPFSSSST